VGDDKKLINGIVARLQKVFQTMRESTWITVSQMAAQ
jgi:hypothetical protein